MIGTVLGNRYTILEEVGTGGMATVYKAHDAYLQRDVAVKVLRSELRGDDDLLRRFEAEARAAASLTHPNIVQIYDVGTEGSVIYIVMELVDGRSLKELIEAHGPMPWTMAVDVMLKIASALQKAHAKKIVHRDIKPQNILLTLDGEPKVADFGIARNASSGMETMKVDTVASVHYASPEQVRGGYTDAQSDIYSAGVTLYEMLTGQLPFGGENPVSVALRHIQDSVPRVDALMPEMPHSLADIVEKCMQKNRADRYADAASLMADLEMVKRAPDGLHVELPAIRHSGNGSGGLPMVRDGADGSEAADIGRDMPVRNMQHRQGGFNAKKLVFPLLYLVLIGIIIALVVNIVGFIKAGLAGTQPTESASREAILGNYVGRDISVVQTELDTLGLKPSQVEIRYQYDSRVPENVVIDQHPLADSKIVIGGLTIVEIVVSKGSDKVTIPEIQNRKRGELRIELQEKLGLSVEEKSEYNDELTADQVIRLDPPAGTQVARGSTITLYWSLGKEQKQVSMPDLIGLDRETAEARLVENRLSIGTVLPADSAATGNMVKKQSVTPGDLVPEGTTVDLTFEKTMPDPTPTPVATATVDPSATPTAPAATDSGPAQTKTTIQVELPVTVTGDTAQLTVVVRNTVTAVEEVLMDATVARADYPYAVVVPIPDGGGITVLIYINGNLELQKEF